MTIVEKYHNAYNEGTLEETENAFKAIDRNIISSKNGEMSVIYLTLTDVTFDRICKDPELLKDINFMINAFREKDKNIHLVKAFGQGMINYREILLSLITKYNPKTLTWFRDDFRLHTIKRR